MVTSSREFVVDGEVFRVELRDDGGFDCAWLTGHNVGYGFGSGAPVSYTIAAETPMASDTTAPARARASDEHVTASIRQFLAMIDPETGYIND